MTADELLYPQLEALLKPYTGKSRTESASFLNWFLENIYRLDDTAADDAICDQPNDKGIDGIYVDHNAEEVHFFQSKLSQKAGRTIGDVALKEFSGSLGQFATKESVDKILSGGANIELKKALMRGDVPNLLEKGYAPIGVYVTNSDKDHNTTEYLVHAPHITVYDRNAIVDNYIEFDAAEGIAGTHSFDASYAGFIEVSVDQKTRIFFLPVPATELVTLGGISDGSLFKQNVRLSLGNTPVNKAIAQSVSDKAEHKHFPLYHNGVTIICKKAEFDKESEKVHITDYVVVNGAQSLSTFYHNHSHLTTDLRVFTKIISLENEELARKITINSNNQNAIKARDLRSNHDLMLRLKAELAGADLPYEFEIKRGETFTPGKRIISNEEAGKLLLAFDLHQPYACHQVYRVFDENYAEIFGRPEVGIYRIIFLFELMELISGKLDEIENKQIARYALTRFILLDAMAHIIRKFDAGRNYLNKKGLIANLKCRERMLTRSDEILNGLIVDFNYEIGQQTEAFDYKKDFKSPESVKRWREELLRTFEKDHKRQKIEGFDAALIA